MSLKRGGHEEPSMEGTVAHLLSNNTEISPINFLEVMKLLKRLNMLGPLGISALTIAYPRLKNSTVFRNMTPTEWHAFIRKNIFDEMLEEALNVAVELSDLESDEEDDEFTKYYLDNLEEEWESLKSDDTNYFHVFVGFLIRYINLGKRVETIRLRRNGEIMSIRYSPYEGEIESYSLREKYFSYFINRRRLPYWDDNSIFLEPSFVSFLYRALQEGWRLHPDNMEGVPKEMLAPIGECAACGTQKQALSQCGGCNRIQYCDATCQRNHWSEHGKQCNWKK